MPPATAALPQAGQIVKCRTRSFLVEEVEPSTNGQGTLVRMSCVDDDNQGAPLAVIWEHELGTELLDQKAWDGIGQKDFDPPQQFAAYFNTTRWNCVTATDPTLFQAPFRAGIHIDAYQLEPLRLALKLPRINLFIADDVGLGKTIEAGLIARELLLRRRVSNIVICAPPSVLEQWREEMEQRFGLPFEIYNRDYVLRIREERGFAVNPWTTHPRFLISEKLLIDDTYRKPLVDWLDDNPDGAPTAISGDRAVDIKPGTLFIFDEAHHAAPASGSKYVKDTKITGAIRDIAPRFEHRLFLSATPHNGHSNSYSALLNILDDTRFAPGIKTTKDKVSEVVVRRLKEDLRQVGHSFPERLVKQIVVRVPDDAPELELPKLLDEYRAVYKRRHEGSSRVRQQQQLIIFSTLRQRLYSSLPAFARTLAAHRKGMERLWRGETGKDLTEAGLRLLQNELRAKSADEAVEDCDLDGEKSDFLDDAQANALLEQASASGHAGPGTNADAAAERRLLDRMRDIAESQLHKPDGRVQQLLQWLQQHCCQAIGRPDEARENAAWTDKRVIIFTEWDETLNYLRQQISARIEGTLDADRRIAIYRGSTNANDRNRIKQWFNSPPHLNPVRILLATDAAREGLNLQAYCSDLFHFDVPWNPGKLEQRNGRIDRKLQPEKQVRCHYFLYEQRPLDRVLEVLIEKTKRINSELGSVGKVLESKLDSLVSDAMTGDAETRKLALEKIAALDLHRDEHDSSDEELESARKRADALREQITSLERHLDRSRKHLGFDSASLRETLNCALQLQQVAPLREVRNPDGSTAWALPPLESKPGKGDWAETLDTLRKPPEDGERDRQWRSEAPIRPLVFDPPAHLDETRVHVHLEHRIVKRLLGRFLAQGFVHHDLSRTCLGSSRDEHTRVVLLGRVALYGRGAARLHEEILCVSARWSDPSTRTRLTVEGAEATKATLQWLQETLGGSSTTLSAPVPDELRRRLHASINTDLSELRAYLQERGMAAAADATKALDARGAAEAKLMRETLDVTRNRILKKKTETDQLQQSFAPEDRDEQRTLELHRRYWKKWLSNVEADLDFEPNRVKNFYRVASTRIEPLGIVYLVGARAAGAR